MTSEKYEISLWEDVLIPQDLENEIPSYYREQKIGIIGSNTMTTNCRAYEPQLIENVNGTNTLRFKMYYVYTEAGAEGVKLQNPWLNLLVNERKVKCLWKDKWYDFVIKNAQEDSGGKSITYTCTDQYINELSKNGFNIELDTELENNQGTAQELVEKVLDGTDWNLATDDSEIIQQEKEEPVYEVITLSAIAATNDTIGQEGTSAFDSGRNILLFYSQIQPLVEKILEDPSASPSGNVYIQFAWAENFQTEQNDQSVLNAECYSINSIAWQKVNQNGVDVIRLGSASNPWCYVAYQAGVSSNYRASRLIRTQRCVLDPLTDKYVNIYKATTANAETGVSVNDEIYEYITTEYKDPTFVNNLVVNSKDFSSTTGWLGHIGAWKLMPEYNGNSDLATYQANSYLKINSGSGWIFNAGLRESSNYIPGGFARGEKYIIRLQISNSKCTPINALSNFRVHIGAYTVTATSSNPNTITPSGSSLFTLSKIGTVNNWIEYRLTCKTPFTRSDIYSNNYGLLINIGTECWLKELQFFPEIYGERDGVRVRINPGEMDINSVVQTVYKYYNHTKSAALIDPEDVKYIYSGNVQWNASFLQAEYIPDFEKVRSISVKNSNRFNILQSIAETFECWIKFVINHDETGCPIYENGSPQKYVYIKREIGLETGIGFIYGLDLKTIQRTIQSDNIVTKTIVSPNNNEFATDGFCTIARSIENYPRDNFILNFDYYIGQGLLNGAELNKDLYLSVGEIGYYYNLHNYNMEYDQITELLRAKNIELLKQESYETLYQNYITSLQEQVQQLMNELMQFAGVTSWSAAQPYIKSHMDREDIARRFNSMTLVQKSIASYQNMLSLLQQSLTALRTAIEDKKQRQDDLVTAIKELNKKFYKKYFSFIKEGSWTSEEYIDDNLYYLDALSVAYTSSRPQISYNISVIRLSGLEEFKNKVFRLGDITFIQDVEFFGYLPDKITPYKEKTLVSEITSNFDSPEKDTFKIQNYKTQFEDLFQRITATTQSLQYTSGEYARAASIVETDGTIKPTTLANSIAMNAQLVYSANNESIINDSTGITVRNLTEPNNMTKITSGGVFITTDGGGSWKNAIRGEGVATQYLTSGVVNTENINLLDGAHQTFRWDSRGINAFRPIYYGDGDSVDTVDNTTFVRFDHYGIYGIQNGDTDFDPDKTSELTRSVSYVGEDKIWKMADFGLTWHGFFLKNAGDSGSIHISSDEDIQVLGAGDTERVKIGRLYPAGTGGYEITDDPTPISGKKYYIKSGLFYNKASLANFTPGIVYYENTDTGYIVTADEDPIKNKTYYNVESYSIDNLVDTFIGNNYWTYDGTEYTHLTDEEIQEGPLPGVNYYSLNVNIIITEATYDYDWSRADGEDCYIFDGESGYILVDQSSDPEAGIQYYIKLDDEEVSYLPIDLRVFKDGYTYYIYENEEYLITEDVVPVLDTYYFINEESSYVTAVLGKAFVEGNTYYYKENDNYIIETSIYPRDNVNYYVGSYVIATIVDQFKPSVEYYEKTDPVYGIRISNDDGAVVMETTDEGNLWLTGQLRVSSTTGGITNDISIGYLPAAASSKHIHPSVGTVSDLDERLSGNEQTFYRRTFDINNKFVVWEDGTMYAQDGYFEGTINATGGKIGNLSIEDIGRAVYRVVITSSNGIIFKNDQVSTTLTAHLYTGETEILTGLTYVWYRDGVVIPGASTKNLVVSDISSDDVDTYDCAISYNGGV